MGCMQRPSTVLIALPLLMVKTITVPGRTNTSSDANSSKNEADHIEPAHVAGSPVFYKK